VLIVVDDGSSLSPASLALAFVLGTEEDPRAGAGAGRCRGTDEEPPEAALLLFFLFLFFFDDGFFFNFLGVAAVTTAHKKEG
jgi:hypothetical protein